MVGVVVGIVVLTRLEGLSGRVAARELEKPVGEGEDGGKDECVEEASRDAEAADELGGEEDDEGIDEEDDDVLGDVVHRQGDDDESRAEDVVEKGDEDNGDGCCEEVGDVDPWEQIGGKHGGEGHDEDSGEEAITAGVEDGDCG